MSLRTGSYGAYHAATRATGTPRDIEYQVFSRVTGALSRAVREDRPFAEIAAALTENLELWTTLAADLARHGNDLPPELRRQLLGLAAFTRDHTHKALRREADPGVLVEINTAVMRGLRGQADAGLPAVEAG